MANFVKFSPFCSALAGGKHDFATASVWFQLCPGGAPPATTLSYESQLTDIATGGSYIKEGMLLGTPSYSGRTGGVYKCVVKDKILTATGAGINPFRYVVLFNQTAANDPLIGYFDYGTAIAVGNGETFTIDSSASGGIFTLS